jgi:DNA-binding CsgD family transcriptional regulator
VRDDAVTMRDTAEERSDQRLLDAVDSVANVGRWDWIPATGAMHWSDNLFRIHGLEPGAITPTAQDGLERIHGDDRERVMTAVTGLLATGAMIAVDFRIVRADGAVRHLRTILAVERWEAGAPALVAGWAQDITEQRCADRWLAAHAAVTEALTSWVSLDDGAAELLAAVAEAIDFSAGILWLPHGDALVAAVLWHDEGVELGEFEALTRAARITRGIDVPGRAWAERAPAGARSPVVSPMTARCLAAAEAGLPGMIAFPAFCCGDVFAVIELVSREQTTLGERLARALNAIGSEVGQFLSRRRGAIMAAPLTPRQLEVLQLAAGGLSARGTGERLGIAAATVEAHLQNVYPRLGVTDKASAVAEGMRLGLID